MGLSSPLAPTALNFPLPLQCLFQPKRFKVLWGGRAGAKSWGIARALLIQGLDGSQRILCARELMASIKDSVHKLLADQVTLMGMNYLYDIQQQGIYGVGSAKGTEFSFEGIRHNVTKIKSYEGLTRCWVEEADKLSESSFDTLVPTLRVPGSELWFSFNPDLDDDFIYQHFCVEVPPTNSVVVKVSYRDNPWLSAEVLAEIVDMRERNYDKYLHIWEGNPRIVLEGAIFAEELRETTAQERICHVPNDRSVPVNVYFDLGRGDHTSMWFEQRVGFEHHLVDFYQNNLKHIDHYLKLMQSRGYLYGTIWLPHDARAKTLGTKMSIEEQVRAAGFTVRIVPRLSIPDRINAARTVFPQCFFDQKRCAEGIRSLKHYKYVEKASGNAKLGILPQYSNLPLHDWASDAADAFTYFAVASKQRGRLGEPKLDLPKSSLLGTLNELVLGGSRGTSTGWLGR